MKKRIVLWGAGRRLKQVIEELDNEKVEIISIIDSDSRRSGSLVYQDLAIFTPEILRDLVFDYIIITTEKYSNIYNDCIAMDIAPQKIIAYWKDSDLIYVSRSKKIKELTYTNKVLLNRLDSAPYEWGIKKIPDIITGEDLLRIIIEKNVSLSRFGDGEFEIIRGNNRPWFQVCDYNLGKRLLEILRSEDDRVLIAIAQVFKLDMYKEENADGIREYMFGNTRADIMRMLKPNKTYYDAYVTRPYMIFKNPDHAPVIFSLYKQIWKDRNIIIVEGAYSRFGMGNDLLSGVLSIRRIICPHKNAWESYSRIKEAVLQEASRKNELVIASLGPTATVLAYDLAKEGIQTLDIGQLDNEYEWWKQGSLTRTAIPGKLVAEYMCSSDYINYSNEDYDAQIVRTVL